jgi:hypothetical protein
MSQENVEIVRSMYEAFNRRDWRRDWDTAFRDQPLDVEFELTTPPEGTQRGNVPGAGGSSELLSGNGDGI